MADKEIKEHQKTCFVVMGFGKKTDFETGRVLDLDKSYRNMIKPAVEAAGYKCIRADEIVHSGLIDVPMYEQLLKADVVVADLSTSNKNAYYELGVRHALRPFTTVVIAEDGIKTFPFDLNHVAVRKYHHLGEDIGYEEVMRFRQLLTDAIETIDSKDPLDKDSPVYTFLNDLTPPALAATVQAAVQGSSQDKASIIGDDPKNKSLPGASKTHSVLMQQVDDAQKKEDWLTAKTLLLLAHQMMNHEPQENQKKLLHDVKEHAEDPYILQRLALVTYKSKSPDEKSALLEAQQLLQSLNPTTSNDTETLGLWGAVHKRLWEIVKTPDYLNEAIRAYERGFYIKNDYYNGINYAYQLHVRSAQAIEPAEAIADFVAARRVRKEVLAICDLWLKDNPEPDHKEIPESAVKDYFKSWYWVMATKGEALWGLGEKSMAQEILEDAYAKAPAGWMKSTTEEQLGKLSLLLEDSPLKYINPQPDESH